MTKRSILVPLLLMMTAFAGAVGAEPLIDGDIEAGEQKAAVCASCHGPAGNSVSPQYPKLAGQGAPYLYQQLKLFKDGTRDNAIMQAQAAGLSDQDMKDLAAYFSAQPTQPGVADPELAQAGAIIYRAGKPEADVPACAGCHGPAGLGNAAARYPRISGQPAQYTADELRAYRENERTGYLRAEVMQSVAEGLSDADIEALAAYLAGLAPAEPGSMNTSGALMQNMPETASAPPADTDEPTDAPVADGDAAEGEADEGGAANGEAEGPETENDANGAADDDAGEAGAAAADDEPDADQQPGELSNEPSASGNSNDNDSAGGPDANNG